MSQQQGGQPLGTAVLGLGRVGPAHARVVAANHRARLVAIADGDAAKLERTAAGFPGCVALADYRDALESVWAWPDGGGWARAPA